MQENYQKKKLIIYLYLKRWTQIPTRTKVRNISEVSLKDNKNHQKIMMIYVPIFKKTRFLVKKQRMLKRVHI